MAYPFYPNYTYPNYPQQNYPVYAQQSYTPQNYTQQNYQTNPVVNQSGIIWISGLQEAQMYPIAPNNAVSLWEKSGKTIYLKSADATGKPTLRVYDLVERSETASDGVSSSDGKLPTYATKDDLAAVVGAVKGMDDVIGAIRSDVDAMKGDMYGIAGKKRPAKKTAEVEEDE